MTVYSELDLHRLTVDEALPELNNFLYHAFTSGMFTVSINHGKGSGILRQAVHRELRINSMVKSFRKGIRGEGGVGVTIVLLADR